MFSIFSVFPLTLLCGGVFPNEKTVSLKTVGKHIFNVSFIRLTDEFLFSEFPLSFGALFGQNVAVIRFIVKYLFLSCYFEPLLGSFVCL